MARGTLAQKLIASHLVSGDMAPGAEIGLRIDQTLTQDATGTLVMLELEAMNLARVETEVSAQYVDHNLIQEDHKNADDHLFLRSAARRFGLWFSRPGNGVSHPVHMAHLGVPGKTLLGSDSHTPAAGSLAMLAIGTGGLDVATAMAGAPYYVKMPEIFGVRVTGALPAWVSAKDVILEMLRRHGVTGGVGRIIEYYGPGLAGLSAMDRHVIANMGAELGATTTVFPADGAVKEFLARQGRAADYRPLGPDADAEYDVHDELDLGEVVPLIAMPSSPGNVVPVADVAGEPIYQAYIGSSANPGYHDIAVVAYMVRGRRVPEGVSLDVNPTSREILQNLVDAGHVGALLAAGARFHQPGCNGCIGMGQAPASGRNSLRTTPRNFPGRSGTREDAVWLCGPETAAASALSGAITDPRRWAEREGVEPYLATLPDPWRVDEEALGAPLPPDEAAGVAFVKGPNVASLPDLAPLPDALEVPVLFVAGDDISTDEILPAGTEVLPFRSNIPRIAEFCFRDVAPAYSERAKAASGGHAIVGGDNYGQGSSREHAALAPRYLGLRVVIARSFARIHWQNLVNFGVLPLTFDDRGDYDGLGEGDVIALSGIREAVEGGRALVATIGDRDVAVSHSLSERQVGVLLAGGMINWMRERRALR